MLIQASSVIYVPQINSVAFICENYTLFPDQQIEVLINDTIGLLNSTTSQILTTGDSNDRTAYSAEGNYSSIITNRNDGGVTQRHFHVAILAEIGKSCTSPCIVCNHVMFTCMQGVLPLLQHP